MYHPPILFYFLPKPPDVSVLEEFPLQVQGLIALCVYVACKGASASGYLHGVYKIRAVKRPPDSFLQLQPSYIQLLPAKCVQCDCWKHTI